MTKDPHREREARNYAEPIASREFILETMVRIGEPVSGKRLARELELEKAEQRDALQTRLRAMVRDGQVVVDRRNVFAIASKMEMIAGRVHATGEGFGFLISAGRDEDIYLGNREMRQVFHGDVAQVRLGQPDRRGRTVGEIVEVLERNTTQVVGRVFNEGKLTFLESLNKKINHEILIDGEGAVSGQIVVAQITEQPSLHGLPRAKVLETLGDHLTPSMETEIALRNHDIPFEFSDAVMAEVDALPHEVAEADKQNRCDLRDLPFVTIDGEDARDYDDAVYCEPKRGGGWRLFVAIADVAHYVPNGSALDANVYERGTSVYFPQYVVPMLPESLSNGLCSLKPQVDRLVLVAEMTISARGRLSGFEFYEGVIHSHARLTYTEVAATFDGGEHPMAEHLGNLHDLYKVLLEVRRERGALDFESNELQFEFDSDDRIVSITPRFRNTAHRVIEECMLVANVAAARLVQKSGKPGLFRVHERPKEERLEGLKGFLAPFGIKAEFDEGVTTLDYQAVLDTLRDRKNGRVLQMALLRSLTQAVYQPENKGHFGLNYTEYTHFTSPIRRFPDLLTHRLIKAEVHSAKEKPYTKRFGPRNKTNWYPYDEAGIVEAGERASYTERRADGAVYDVLEWIKCDFISDRVGDDLRGVITGVTKFGLFVELNDVFVEGLIHVSTLAGDYYSYDQTDQRLVGERTGVGFGLGDGVVVQVIRVDVDERKVDLEMLEHEPLPRTQSSGRKRREGKKKTARGGDTKAKARGEKSRSGKKSGGGRRRRR